MAEISPFRGIFYAPDKFNPDKVVCPPYDIISPSRQNEYYRSSPSNFIRLELGKVLPTDNLSNNCYTRARKFFQQWLDKGILVQDSQPSLYPYEQSFSLNGKKEVRRGFLTLVQLEDFNRRVILPHEKTHSLPKEDRLQLLRHCRANFSPIFALYPDRSREISGLLEQNKSRSKLLEAESNGVQHCIWRIIDWGIIRKLQELLSAKQLLIADGHHRYETALNFFRESGYNYVLMFLSPLEGEEGRILPTHRLLQIPGLSPESIERKLGKYLSLVPVKNRKELLEKMKELSRTKHTFGLVLPEKLFLLILNKRTRQLDVNILHQLILEKILGVKDKKFYYTRDPQEVFREIGQGNYNLGFLLNPCKADQVMEVARQGETLPQKSTYFYPKVLAGLVVNKID